MSGHVYTHTQINYSNPHYAHARRGLIINELGPYKQGVMLASAVTI